VRAARARERLRASPSETERTMLAASAATRVHARVVTPRL